jgi:hypothetical protein
LETRGLHALTREKAIDSLAMNAQHTADTHGVETAVVDEAPDRLGMHTELICDLANADETGISAFRRHAVASLVQVGPHRMVELSHRHRPATYSGLDVAIRRNALTPTRSRVVLLSKGRELRERATHTRALGGANQRDDCRQSASSDPGLGAPCSERLPEEPQPAVSAASARTTSKARARTL